MSARGCQLIAVEGTHCSGKTTLVHALAAEICLRNVRVAVVPEAARLSGFVEDSLLRNGTPIDLVAELHLLASHIANELAATRNSDIVLIDRSTLSVLAYCDVLFAPSASAMLSAMTTFCTTYTSIYDALIFLTDEYAIPPRDRFRPTSPTFQTDVARALNERLLTAQCPTLSLDVGLTHTARVNAIIHYLERTAILLPL